MFLHICKIFVETRTSTDTDTVVLFILVVGFGGMQFILSLEHYRFRESLLKQSEFCFCQSFQRGYSQLQIVSITDRIQNILVCWEIIHCEFCNLYHKVCYILHLSCPHYTNVTHVRTFSIAFQLVFLLWLSICLQLDYSN